MAKSKNVKSLFFLLGEVMSEVKIELINVGRAKVSKTVTFKVSKKNHEFTPDDIAAIALKEARKHLRSSNVQIVYDIKKKEGTIFAGIRAVGKFKVVKT